MKNTGPMLRSMLAAATLLVASLHPAFADTYKLFNLGSDEGRFLYGFDDSGVVLDNPSCLPSTCYSSFIDGLSTGPSTAIAPDISLDEGTPCTPSVPTGDVVFSGVCNNGRDALEGFLSSGQVAAGVYSGPDASDLIFTQSIGAGEIYLNSVGDIVFNDPHGEFWYEAIRETPEPNSLLLLGTGVFATLAAVRRRLRL